MCWSDTPLEIATANFFNTMENRPNKRVYMTATFSITINEMSTFFWLYMTKCEKWRKTSFPVWFIGQWMFILLVSMWKRGFFCRPIWKVVLHFIVLLTRPNITLAVCVIVRYFQLARDTTIGYVEIFILNWLTNINSLIPFGYIQKDSIQQLKWYEARRGMQKETSLFRNHHIELKYKKKKRKVKTNETEEWKDVLSI